MNKENWIPCTERLPQKSKVYLATVIEYHANATFKHVEFAGYIAEQHQWICEPYQTVTAWQETPVPYDSL